MRPREFGLELGADSRIDRDYRVQGWFTPEVEVGISSRWLLEGGASFVNRGRGLEFGTWHAETRFLLERPPDWPVAVAASIEYETETRAAKHPALERAFVPRVVVSGTMLGSLYATLNLGLEMRLTPFYRRGTVYGVGVRYPEGSALSCGLELRREPLEGETRLGPEFRIVFPGEKSLRLGGTMGLHSRPYRFIGRAVLETEW
jgi:hypothetical protein